MGASDQGKCIHQRKIDGLILSDVVVIALIDIYAKWGSIDKACELLDRMPQINVMTWIAMIAGYSQN